MNHATLLQKIPSSIYTKEANSNNAKLWNIYASEANEIENGLTPFYDVDSLSGINLDKMSLILGIERNGRNDADYRNALYDFQNNEIDTASLSALYAALRKELGFTGFRVTELAYPREMEEDLLDGNGFWDGSGNLDPNDLRPKIVEFWDGLGPLDGLEPLEPCFIRPASILIEIIATSSYMADVPFEDFDAIDFKVSIDNVDLSKVLLAARSVLIPGIGIYIKEKI
jgi:hypothetical protein